MGIYPLTAKAIFLDRDGVLNHAIIRNKKPYPPSTLDELTIPDGVQTGLNRLKLAGFLLIGATNQPDVARGTTPRSMVEAINAKLIQTLNLDEIRVCYHDDVDHCLCRKPLPGLLIAAANDYHIDLEKSFMIGDRWKDIEAGILASCKTIWLRAADYQEKEPPRPPSFITASFLEASDWILSLKENE